MTTRRLALRSGKALRKGEVLGSGMRMWLKWLYPGMRMKRWLLLGGCGVLLLSAGLQLAAGLEILAAVERMVIRAALAATGRLPAGLFLDRKSTRLNSST